MQPLSVLVRWSILVTFCEIIAVILKIIQDVCRLYSYVSYVYFIFGDKIRVIRILLVDVTYGWTVHQSNVLNHQTDWFQSHQFSQFCIHLKYYGKDTNGWETNSCIYQLISCLRGHVCIRILTVSLIYWLICMFIHWNENVHWQEQVRRWKVWQMDSEAEKRDPFLPVKPKRPGALYCNLW